MTPLASKQTLQKTIAAFNRARIIVIGDIMLDHFIRGNVSRISPEAPVPVVSITAESLRLGGAANVVYNINALGGAVYGAGMVGSDEMGQKIRQQFRSLNLDTQGLIVTNPGVLKDGRVKVYVTNVGRHIIVVKPGDDIAQMTIEPLHLFDWVVKE